MVALTRAKVLSPAVLLVDEITANMDPASRTRTKEMLKALSESGVAVVVASHDTGQFEDIADQHITLDGGSLKPSVVSADVIHLKKQNRQ